MDVPGDEGSPNGSIAFDLSCAGGTSVLDRISRGHWQRDWKSVGWHSNESDWSEAGHVRHCYSLHGMDMEEQIIPIYDYMLKLWHSLQTFWCLIYFVQSVEFLYVGRLMAGMTGGACYVVLPTFISEIADTK